MTLRFVLLCGAASLAAASPAFAADNDAFMATLAAMPRAIAPQAAAAEALPVVHVAANTQVPPAKPRTHAPRAPKAAPVAAAPDATVSELSRKVAEQQAQIALLTAKFDTAPPAPVAPKPDAAPAAKPDAPSWTLANGHPVVASADGRFSLALRVLGQFDAAYYAQGARATQLAAANAPDLSSGHNFRRMQFGVQGKVFGDWSYQFNYDFGGSSGSEGAGRIQAAYVEYTGFAPFAVRVGAFPASAGLEDNTSAADTMFLERNAPAELARNIAGGDGRDAIAVSYVTDRIYGAIALTGNKIADAGSFDEQQALVGRISGLVYTDDNAKLVVSANSTYVAKVADSTAGPAAPRNVTLSVAPELTVDNTGAKLVNTGAMNAENVVQWGLETGAQYKNFYGQAGYFGYEVGGRGGAADASFSGWYAQTSWVLTGESRGYNTASGAFGAPKPATPFSLDGDNWGALELAARYSDLDLNSNAGTVGSPAPAGAVRGGEQRIATVGLNWYPNTAVRFELQAQNTQVSRIGTIPAGFGHGTLTNAEVGQSFNTIALRSQVSF